MSRNNKHDWSGSFVGDVCRVCHDAIPTGTGKCEHIKRHVRDGVVSLTGDGTRDNPYHYFVLSEAKSNRFVWCIGAIREAFPDIQSDIIAAPGCHLYDRQEHKIVVTINGAYQNAFCLETNKPNDHPFSRLEEWMNGLSNECLASENIAPTK